MIEAELRGKIRGNEDTLTSTALGLLAFLPDRAFIGFLRTAKSVGPDHQPLIAEGAVMDECELWPWLNGAGQPDARLRFAGAYTTHVVIEAKRGAGAHGGQLVRYGKGMDEFVQEQHQNAETRIALLYLTHHRQCPCAELVDAQAAHLAGGGTARFFWSNWYRLSSFLHHMIENEQDLTTTERRICSALIRYLKGIGFGVFTGFSPYPGADHVQPFLCRTRFERLPAAPPRFLNRRRFQVFHN